MLRRQHVAGAGREAFVCLIGLRACRLEKGGYRRSLAFLGRCQSHHGCCNIGNFVAQGVVEVMLLGQNVNSYGKLTRGEINFAQLLGRVDAIEGL